MLCRDEVIEAINKTTEIMNGVDNTSKAQDSRENAAVCKLFKVVGLPRPNSKEIEACLPW